MSGVGGGPGGEPPAVGRYATAGVAHVRRAAELAGADADRLAGLVRAAWPAALRGFAAAVPGVHDDPVVAGWLRSLGVWEPPGAGG